MLLLYTAEFIIIGILLLGIVTQVLIPLAKNRPLFPILRPKERAARDLGKAQEDLETLRLRQEVKRLRKREK